MPNNLITILNNLITFTGAEQSWLSNDAKIKASVFYLQFFEDLRKALPHDNPDQTSQLIEFYYHCIRRFTITAYLQSQLKQTNIKYLLTNDRHHYSDVPSRTSELDPYNSSRYYRKCSTGANSWSWELCGSETIASSPLEYLLKQFGDLLSGRTNQKLSNYLNYFLKQ